MTKSVLVTGCSLVGIGDAIAREYHNGGFRVFATARNLDRIAHLQALGLDVLPLDVTSDESIRTAVKSVRAATGGNLDILVNNAGAGISHVFRKYLLKIVKTDTE